MTSIFNVQKLKARRRELRDHQTDAEKVLWQRLRSKSLCGMKFFRQYSVGMYILDFYCPKTRLAIEVDGEQHMENEAREYDEIRTDYLESLGIEVIRFWNNEVIENIEGALQKIVERITPPNLPFNKGEGHGKE